MSAFAFVFPGQGSQSVGMLNSVAERPEVRATLQEASDALGEDVAKLISDLFANAAAPGLKNNVDASV